MSLIMGLLFLALFTLLGLTVMGTTTLEERMALNSQDRTLAFDAAEAALRDCERVLQGAGLPAFDGTHGLYQPAALGSTPIWQSIDWNDATAVRTHAATPTGAMAPPGCIIEELPEVPGDGNESLAAGKPLPDSGMYRITARGVGSRPETVVMLQSTYVR